MRSLKFAFGPMSLDFINAISNYSKKKKIEVMLIASRNQIECADLGSGYVNNFSTEAYAKYIKSKKNKYIKLCRDHSGPFLSDTEKNINLKNGVERTKQSLRADILSGFSMLHIDTSRVLSKKYAVAEELFDFCNNLALENRTKIKFEFGSEDHGVKVSTKEFLKDLDFFFKIKNSKYLVCQTGSLVKEKYQVGSFDFFYSRKMSSIAKQKNIFLKEHNCDYLTKADIKLREKANIGAINVAPEIGVLQTELVLNYGKIFGLEKQINSFKKVVLKGNKWKKWLYANKISEDQKLSISGHYFFCSHEYKNLVYELKKKFNLNNVLQKNFYKYLDKFYEN